MRLSESRQQLRPAVHGDLAEVVRLQRERFPFMATEDATELAASLAHIVEHPDRGAVIVLVESDRIDGAAVIRLRRGGPVVLESICKRSAPSAGLRDERIAALFDAVVLELLRLGTGLGAPAFYFNSSHAAVLRGFRAAVRRSGRLQFAGTFGNDHWYSYGPVSPWRTLLRHRGFILRRWLLREQVLEAGGRPVHVSLRQPWSLRQ